MIIPPPSNAAEAACESVKIIYNILIRFNVPDKTFRYAV
jgi:hypothetical protein